ncbi:MAG: hypothetical protein WCV84_05580 [Patescibacteria group bacterium]
MQLPEALQHFPEPTLIVVGDHIHTKFWIARDTILEEADAYILPREHLSDNETSHGNANVGQPYTIPVKDDERLRKYTEEVASRIADFVREGGVTVFHFVMPAEVSGEIIKKLPDDVAKHLKKTIDANLGHASITEAVERVVEALPFAD